MSQLSGAAARTILPLGKDKKRNPARNTAREGGARPSSEVAQIAARSVGAVSVARRLPFRSHGLTLTSHAFHGAEKSTEAARKQGSGPLSRFCYVTVDRRRSGFRVRISFSSLGALFARRKKGGDGGGGGEAQFRVNTHIGHGERVCASQRECGSVCVCTCVHDVPVQIARVSVCGPRPTCAPLLVD